jgi:ferric-dicitrate binding protein FerR (iron transport regulator)
MNREVLSSMGGARCRLLGDLAEGIESDRQPDIRQWDAIEEGLPGRSHRWRPRRLILVLPALAGLTLWIVSGRTLGVQTQDCFLGADGQVSVSDQREGQVSFDDGTRITLAKSVRGGVHGFGFWRGAQLALQSGHADLSVVHRWGRRWEVLAGPFQVRVTGTRFQVDWAPERGQFILGVSQGEVRVSGGPLAVDTPVRAGQRLSVDTITARVILGEASDGPAQSQKVTATPKEIAEEVVHRPEVAPPPAERRPRRHSGTSNRSKLQDSAPVAKRKVAQTDLLPGTAGLPEPVLTERDWSAAQAAEHETASAPSGPHRLTVGGEGGLSGGARGSVYVARGAETRFTSPADDPLDHFYKDSGMLCTRGTVYALTCVNDGITSRRCDWSTNWGVMLGWRPRQSGEAWGSGAATSISMEFQGKHGKYGLVAHREGDPPKKVYCVANYRSGQKVTPSQFKLDCWQNPGESLPDFSKVDSFAVHFPSGSESMTFKYCLAAVNIF